MNANAEIQNGTETIPGESSGNIVSVRGSVVDVCFKTRLPPLQGMLYAGQDNRVVLEVMSVGLSACSSHRSDSYSGSGARHGGD
jgi:hypothetical protein